MALAVASGLLGGCRARAVRVLADERLQRPIDEGLALFEMRTGQRLRVTYATPERIDILLHTGAHDVLIVDLLQVEAQPVTSLFDLSTARALGKTAGGVTLGCVMRRGASGRQHVVALWRFLQEDEFGVVLRSAGVMPTASTPAQGPR
jgi:hypothetical protein